MNDMLKSIRVGAVDFFGILIPGLLLIVICGTGFFLPMFLLVLDLTGAGEVHWLILEPVWTGTALFVLIVLSYVLGYVLRLSSPDQLDRISAEYVLTKEREHNKYFDVDAWPYDFQDPQDKYPYFNFRNYLVKRGHTHLTDELVTWGHDEKVMKGESWPDKARGGKSIKITKRSKSVINKMKIDVNIYCPALAGLLESKEGHIRLLAGVWEAFRFSKIFLRLSFPLVLLAALFFQFPGWWSSYNRALGINYFIYVFIISSLGLLVHYSGNRIEKLFHYRRVNELFHIVQAAYIAQQFKKVKNAETAVSK